MHVPTEGQYVIFIVNSLVRMQLAIMELVMGATMSLPYKEMRFKKNRIVSVRIH